MSRVPSPHSRVQRLASLIEQDVRRRGLAVGDAYLTAAEAGKDFGTDPFTATRAMSMLAQQNLIRKQGVGTFVGENVQESPLASLRSLHVFSTGEPGKGGFPIGQVLERLHDEMPGFEVHSTLLPEGSTAALVRGMIERDAAEGSLAGILLMGCPREVQQVVLDCHVPAMSLGSVYPDALNLPSFEVDQFEVGRLAAEHLLKRGHARIALLMRDIWRPGDNRLLAGVNQAMADAGATCDALITRSVAEDTGLIEREIKRLLTSKQRPTGVICRSSRFAEIARDVVESEGLKVPADLDIVFNYHDRTLAETLRLPCVCPELSPQAQVASVANMLKRLVEEKELETNHVLLPVNLFEPIQQRK